MNRRGVVLGWVESGSVGLAGLVALAGLTLFALERPVIGDGIIGALVVAGAVLMVQDFAAERRESPPGASEQATHPPRPRDGGVRPR